MFSRFFDLLFPTKCLRCNEEGSIVCDECFPELPPAPQNWSRRPSGLPIEAVFDYRDPTVRRGIWLWKYKGRRDILNIFARALYDQLLQDLGDQALFSGNAPFLLVPIPLAFWRRRMRGFNQTEMLAQVLASLDNGGSFIYTPEILKKTRGTEPQTSLMERAARLRNIKDCFCVTKPELVTGKNIILLDDVYTTGTTLEGAAKTLRAAGAKKVRAYTIAH
ncbi:MAG: ComF family protein [Parcubacteria group bacterium]|nr:ComF family protein [Parcubacteria group bacterium]